MHVPKKIENYLIAKDKISIIRIGMVENLFDENNIAGPLSIHLFQK